MKIHAITIKNYRCFEEITLSLGDKITLLVGKNGTGKTAILDAIAVTVSAFLGGIEGGISRNIQKEDARYQFYDLEGIVDTQHQFPVILSAEGECGGISGIKWNRSLNSADGKTTMKEASQLTDIARKMQSRIMAGDTEAVLPILSYYGTGRLYARKRKRKDLKVLQKFSRQTGYIDCMLAETNEELMLSWFEKMTLKDLQNQQKTGRINKILQLETVEQAICRCFKSISGYEEAEIFFDLETYRIMMEYAGNNGKKYRFALNELSDGYKNTLSMIGDIAYRMAVLNPQLGGKILAETPGIILIDEIDLHLHPQWQQTIAKDLRTIFPKVQFIITSHAPAVIHSIEKENIRILDGKKVYMPTEQTYGRDVNSILREVMQVGERPEKIQHLLSAFYGAIDDEKVESAESYLKQLVDIVGDTDPEVSGARVTLDFEKMRARSDFDTL